MTAVSLATKTPAGKVVQPARPMLLTQPIRLFGLACAFGIPPEAQTSNEERTRNPVAFDTNVGQAFQSDVRLESLTYDRSIPRPDLEPAKCRRALNISSRGLPFIIVEDPCPRELGLPACFQPQNFAGATGLASAGHAKAMTTPVAPGSGVRSSHSARVTWFGTIPRRSGGRATAKAHAQSVFLRQRRDTAPEHLGSNAFARVASRRDPGFKSRIHRPCSLVRLRGRDRGCLGSKERTVPGLRAQEAMRHCSTVSRSGDSAFVDPKSWQKMAVYDSESARRRIISVGATLSEIRVSDGRTLALR